MRMSEGPSPGDGPVEGNEMRELSSVRMSPDDFRLSERPLVSGRTCPSFLLPSQEFLLLLAVVDLLRLFKLLTLAVFVRDLTVGKGWLWLWL